VKAPLSIAAALLLLSARGAAEEELEVVVEGERPTASSRDPTAASSIVRRAALERPGADAVDVLEDVPGVQVTRTGSGADLATASIRGATSAQTPIYLAGIRLNDDVTGTADLSQVPLWMLDRVEVFRGNAPLAADRLGIGGAIFFEPMLPSRSRLGAGAEIGSFGELSTWTGGAAAGDGAAALFALRRQVADNDFEYTDDRGTTFVPSDDRTVRRENADHDSTDAWAIGRWQLDTGGRVTLISNAFRREQGVTGLGVIPATAARARVQRFLAGLSARLPCSKPAAGEPLGACQLELASSFLEAGTDVLDPARELGLAAPEVASTGQRFVQEARVLRRIDQSVVSGGLSQELERLRVAAVGVSTLRARRAATRLTLSAESRAGALLVHALGAFECHGTAGPEGADRCGTAAPSGRLGAALDIGDHLTLVANLARSVRVPTLGELYGISPAVRGSPELGPETALSADLGVRAASTRTAKLHVFGEAFAFARFIDDLVAFRRSGFGYVRPFNVERARVLGAELAAGADALSHVRSEVAVTLLDPRDTSPGRQLENDLVPYQSRLVASARVELYAEKPLPRVPLDRAAIGARGSHRASRLADSAGLIVIDEQTRLDLDARVQLFSRRIALGAAIENVLDARDFDTLGFPLPGRSFHGALEAWWW
jgi:iron complex outermembrane receptor protein